MTKESLQYLIIDCLLLIKILSYNDTNFNYDGSTIYVIRLENAKQNFDINKFNISYSENFYSLKRHQRFYNSKSYKINYQDQSFKDYLHYTGIRVPYDNMNRANTLINNLCETQNSILESAAEAADFS